MALSAKLAFSEGKSDKVYHASVAAYRDGFIVNYLYGRRGGTLQSGTKTRSAVPLADATRIFEALVAEKLAKGYALEVPQAPPAPAAAPVAPAAAEPAANGPALMLLNAIDETRLMALMQNDDWQMEEKIDGHRRTITRRGALVTGGNRSGLVVPVSDELASMILGLKTKREADFMLDGELVGDVYWPFDILRYDGIDLTGWALDKRLAVLEALLDTLKSPYLGRVAKANTVRQKVALFDQVTAARGEGVVFKKLSAKYTPGRPNVGGNALKFKFLGSATCVVVKQNGEKSSVFVAVLNGSDWIEVGKVTIPPNHKVPTPGTYVEVEYMNLQRGGSLYQAVYKGERDDKSVADQYESLRFKGEAVKPAAIAAPVVNVNIRPTVKEAASAAAYKAAATRKASQPAPAPKPVIEPGMMNAAHKAWATRRAKAAAAAAAA